MQPERLETPAERLKHARKCIGLNQEELGILIRMSKPRVCLLEKGKLPITRRITGMLYLHHGISPDWIMCREPQPPSPEK